jgi:hypothetical protein
MSIARKVVVGLAAAIVPVGMVTVIGSEAASAGSPPVDGTGTVACTGVTALMKFNPPLSLTGTASSESVSLKFTLHGCSVSGTTNVTSANFNGKGKGTITAANNNCTGLAGTQPVSGSIPIKWTGKAGTAHLTNTTLTLTSITGLAAGANGNVGFTISHQATSGSFAGTMSGELDSNEGSSAALTSCQAKKGLKLLNIVSGHTSQP